MLVVSVSCISEPLVPGVVVCGGLDVSYVRPHEHLVLGVVQVGEHIRPRVFVSRGRLSLVSSVCSEHLLLDIRANKSLELYFDERKKGYRLFGVMEGVFAVIGRLFGIRK